MALTAHQRDLVERLRSTLDARAGTYRALNGATDVADYLGRGTAAEDEETLTEPLLRELLQRLLGFPPDGYFEQLSRLGSKPDFTPVDLVAHRFVLDAKSTAQRDLDAHEPQIRRYVDQRRLDYGVLFNLREMRVYERGRRAAVRGLSFPLLPLWQLARGEALPTSEVERLERFFEVFRHRTLDQEAKVRRVRQAPAWREVASAGDPLRVDIDYLVDRLRRLSRELADDAAARQDDLERHLTFNPARADALVAELRTLALDLAPGSDPEELPASVDGCRSAAGLPGRVWEQYLLRVAQLALTRILLYRSWEDAGFVEERLYDGGFGRLYDRLDRGVQRVLGEAFDAGRGRYRWLFDADNNYDWYRPRDEALIEVLYALSPVPLGRLDADVLGGLYESYVDEIDRDRLGQFYTPRSVVRFMLDRAGFEGPGGVFASEKVRRLGLSRQEHLVYRNLVERDEEPVHRMLGHPDVVQNDPRAGQQELLLLQVDLAEQTVFNGVLVHHGERPRPGQARPHPSRVPADLASAVGIDRETAKLAVNSIRAWWDQLGSARYPEAKTLQFPWPLRWATRAG
jgi:hypothetical protein